MKMNNRTFFLLTCAFVLILIVSDVWERRVELGSRIVTAWQHVLEAEDTQRKVF